jgi:hypothetical protein
MLITEAARQCEERPDRQHWIKRDVADPAILPRFLQMAAGHSSDATLSIAISAWELSAVVRAP